MLSYSNEIQPINTLGVLTILVSAVQGGKYIVKVPVTKDEAFLLKKIAHQLYLEGVIPSADVGILCKIWVTKGAREYVGMQKKAVESLEQEGR